MEASLFFIPNRDVCREGNKFNLLAKSHNHWA